MSETFAPGFYDRYWEFRVERGDAVAENRVKLRHEQAAAFIRRRWPRSEGVRVLDLGCGDGIMGQILTPDGYEVVGADVSVRALEMAAAHYARTTLLNLDTDPTPTEWREAFDAVICLEVLEHIERPQPNIARCFDVCRPGGAAVFSFPNLFSIQSRWAFLRGRWPRGYTTYDPREHLQVLELPVFKRWVADAGFRIRGVAITPQLPRWNPLRKVMFAARGILSRCRPALWAMQINLFAERPPR